MTADETIGERIDVLLVEPNPGDTRLFTESFRDGKLANTLHVVTDAEAALDFVQQRGEHADKPRPNLVLLEPQLPGKSGRELLAELDDDPALHDVPVVVLTGSDTGEEIVRSHGIDADHFLRKPVEPEEFIDFVRSIEDFWLAIIEQPAADD